MKIQNNPILSFRAAVLCLGILFGLFSSESCQKDFDFSTDPSAKLGFTTDTLRFDTVFTTVGSATRYFKVKNDNNKPLKISRIWIDNSLQSATFNLNVDGISGRDLRDIEVDANDSIYVFVEVTVDPNNVNNAFVITNTVNFETNTNLQKVVVEAWGQNANYVPSRYGIGGVVAIDLGGGTWVWDDPKPYVIYGYVVIRNGTLEIPAGCRIHVHGALRKDATRGLFNDGLLVIDRDAKMVVRGTKEKPVIIQGDRLEPEFKDESGQWVGILLNKESTGNEASFLTVKNSKVGIYADSNATLTLKNCTFKNMSGSAIIGRHASISADNCLVHDIGTDALELLYGGNYTFNYCTLTSFGSKNPALAMNNWFCFSPVSGGCEAGFLKVFPLTARFKNCIFYGSKDDEISISDATANSPQDCDFGFTNCIFKVKDLLKTENYPNFIANNTTDCINANSSVRLFKKIVERNFQLDSLSIADAKAMPIPSIPTDLNLKPRHVSTPDIGCFEY